MSLGSRIVMFGAIVLQLFLCIGAAPGQVTCGTGCALNPAVDSANEPNLTWQYIPGVGSGPGTCNPSCTWQNCHFVGQIKVTNNTGEDREIFDHKQNSIGTISSGQNATYTLAEFEGACGDSDPETWTAKTTGGVWKSSYRLGCTACPAVGS